ncbi:MAG: hypothetical protein WBB85_14840 [Albidovulum sp.]|uniref:hypothetical protein n=1 Tax=Albidovulum sp. TaxID=1872424 RepID=UPI003C8560F7
MSSFIGKVVLGLSLATANVGSARFAPVHASRSIGQYGLSASFRRALFERLLY